MLNCLKYCLLMLVGFLFVGCFSFESVDVRKDNMKLGHSTPSDGVVVRHAVVSNYGWYLFNRWPMVCGNARVEAFLPWAFFRNDVKEDVLQDRLTRHARDLNCDLSEITLFNYEQIFLDIYSIPVPIPYVLTYRELQFSALLTRPDDGVHARAREQLLNNEMRNLLKRISDGGAQ